MGVRDRNFVYASCFSFPPPSFLALMARVAEEVWRLFQRLFAKLFQGNSAGAKLQSRVVFANNRRIPIRTFPHGKTVEGGAEKKPFLPRLSPSFQLQPSCPCSFQSAALGRAFFL